jgi:hypothetical protein
LGMTRNQLIIAGTTLVGAAAVVAFIVLSDKKRA